MLNKLTVAQEVRNRLQAEGALLSAEMRVTLDA